MEIKYTDFGIGWQYDNVIELNKNLKQYPKLLKKVLNHEKQHLRNKENFIKDFITDIKGTLGFKDSLFLLKNHPKMCLQSIAPFWIENKKAYFNFIAIVLYSLLISSGIILMKVIL